MGRISEARFGDVLPILDRYRPVALAAAAVLVIVTILPGADRGGGTEVAAPASALGGTPATTPTTAVPGDVAPAGGAVAAPSPPEASLPLPAPARSSFSAAPPLPSAPPTTSAPIAQSEPSDARTASEPPPSPPAADAPLRPSQTAWATASAGTPLAAIGVPEATLPVGTRLGGNDKVSFVLLEGTATELVLTEEAEGARGIEPAVVQACRITVPGWGAGEAKSFDDAPTWDGEACAPGSRAEGGTWRFDLSAFDGRDDLRGFALVPGPGAPVDVQVAFRV